MSHELAQTRIKAIETGVAQKFRYQPGKGVYEITPCPAGLLELQKVLKEDDDLLSSSSDSTTADTTVSPYGEELSSAIAADPLEENSETEEIVIVNCPKEFLSRA
ncbi:MAG: hypothetical protein R3C11_23620 [Planctomycetaceae bacterium]